MMKTFGSPGSPSQTHRSSTDILEASKPDRVHQSLGSAWASFLSAQHCNREVNAIRKTINEHVLQTNTSIASLQTDAASKRDALATTVEELKSKIDQHAVELGEAATLRTSLSGVQQEIDRHAKEAARGTAELSTRVQTQQDGLAGLRSSIFQEVTAIKEQYRLALEKVEALQAELKETKAQKMTLDEKIALLESQINSIVHTRQELSEDMVMFLHTILSRRDGLTKLLDKQSHDASDSGPQLAGPMGLPLSQVRHNHHREIPQHRKLSYEQSPAQPTDDSRHSDNNNQPAAALKRKPEEALQSQPKRPAPPTNGSQDLRSLYLLFRDRYKASPPKSDTVFIWEFISSIENPTMSRHIQESLAAVIPEHVTPSRDTRRKNPQKHVDISRGLTWRKFREALVKIPGPR